MMQTVTLKNGVDMPLQGFGVFQVPDAADGRTASADVASQR